MTNDAIHKTARALRESRDDVKNYTFQLFAFEAPSLSFTVDKLGRCLSADWTDGALEAATETLDRDEIERRELSRYFDEAGILDTAKLQALLPDIVDRHDRADKAIDQALAGVKSELPPIPDGALWAFPGNLAESEPLDIFPLRQSTRPMTADETALAKVYWEDGRGIGLGPFSPRLTKAQGDPLPECVTLALEWRQQEQELNTRFKVKELDAAQLRAWRLRFSIREALTAAPARTFADLLAKVEALADLAGEDWEPFEANALISIRRDIARGLPLASQDPQQHAA